MIGELDTLGWCLLYIQNRVLLLEYNQHQEA